MQFLLIALVAFLSLSSAFAWDPGPAPGVTPKNAILYLLTLGLLLRSSVDRNFRIDLPGLHVVFAVLIVYSILSYLAVILVIDYPHYDALGSGLSLKGFWDQMLFFLVFFYGLRTDRDALFILKCLLVTWALSHVVAVLDAVGLYELGGVEQREDGRVQGVVGEANQYGAFVALSLPPMVAAIITTRGIWRIVWLGAAAITAVTLLMTVSRGAFVGLAVACVWGMLLLRRYVPARVVLMWAGGAMISVVLLVIMTMALGFGDLLYERLVAGTSGDMVSTSSGRTEIWSDALEAMMEQPVTMLSGYGWRAYWVMPFRWSPHNQYLNQWFNLGLIGLACSVLLLALPIRAVRSAVAYASSNVRPVLMAFIVGSLAFGVAAFFVDIYNPWFDFWAYAGVVLRLAVNARASAAQAAPPAFAQAAPRTDSFGWIGVARR